MLPSKSSQATSIRTCRVVHPGNAPQRVGFTKARGIDGSGATYPSEAAHCVCKAASTYVQAKAADSPCEHNKSFKGRTAMKLKLWFGLLVGMAVTLSSLTAHAAPGAVYTLSNASSGNAVLVYSRAANGQLSPAGMFPTGGLGSGKGLGNQGALAIDEGNRFLFAVNPASNSVSVFRIKENSLQWIEADPSGGVFPISLTVNRGVLYVLNNGGAAGSTDTIAGFTVSHDGHLTPIVSGLALSAATVGPAQIGFDTDGDVLLVTEKSTNNLDIFSVDANGVASGPTVIPSAGKTPFGFAFG